MTRAYPILIAYVACSIVHCVCLWTARRRLAAIIKPMLMPLLLLFYLAGSDSPDALIAAAIAAGFLGDVFLIGKDTFFLAGMASFLAGHLFYILAFLNAVDSAAWRLRLLPALAAVVLLAYGVMIFRRLEPHLGKLKIVLIPYVVVLLAMGFFALLYFVSNADGKGAAVFAGALLFIASDSFLAFGIFVKGKRWRDVAVMATYTLAQGLLVSGLMK